MTYGHVDLIRWMEHKRKGEFLRVFLDGQDVTLRCVEANDTTGEVVLLCRDPKEHRWQVAEGAAHLTPDGGDAGAHKHRVRGQVVIQPGAPQ